MFVLINSLAYPSMPQSQSPTPRTRAKSGALSTETESRPIYGEQRLWTAIIVMALQDYEGQLVHIRKLWDGDKRQVPRYLFQALRVLRYEIQHEWFAHVCFLAEQDHSTMVAQLKRLDEKYKLSEVQFTDSDNPITRYQLRKAKKRLQYA